MTSVSINFENRIVRDFFLVLVNSNQISTLPACLMQLFF